METTINIIPIEEQYRSAVSEMMKQINDEFFLPPPHPEYRVIEPDFYWVAITNGIVIGSIALLFVDGYAVLKNMFVQKDFRGKEHGAAVNLLKIAIQKCQMSGIGDLYLGTLDAFIAAQKFYEKNGFIKVNYKNLPDLFPHNLSDNIFYHTRFPSGIIMDGPLPHN
jgi:N-acetylglutamate synthase-like GNAT family acetyltransferase